MPRCPSRRGPHTVESMCNSTNLDFSAVKPVRPVAPYVGGKRGLAKRLCAIIEATPHDIYLEPFVGMGGVFFRRKLKPKAEIINDWNGELVNLFRCMRAHPAALNQLLEWTFSCRADFEQLKAADTSMMTDLQRAARFVQLQKMAFGGRVVGQTFGVSKDGPARYRSVCVSDDLTAASRRLQGVTIENLDWLAFIDRYDRPGALFYLDPPYYGTETYYGDGFSRDQFRRMADRLGRLEGRFILSLNDHDDVRDIFSQFSIEGVSTSYGLAGTGAVAAKEVIITG